MVARPIMKRLNNRRSLGCTSHPLEGRITKRTHDVFRNPNPDTAEGSTNRRRSNRLSMAKSPNPSIPGGLKTLGEILVDPATEDDSEVELETFDDDCEGRAECSETASKDSLFENVMYEVDAHSRVVTDSTEKSYRGLV